MLLALIITYAVSLIYIAISERFRHYAILIGLQGWLLMFIALMQLGGNASLGETVFIMAETLVFKGVLVPWLLYKIIKNTGVSKVHKVTMPTFISMLLSLVALVVSLALTRYVSDVNVNSIFLGVSLFGLLTGLILITTRLRLFSHLIGFLVIENTVFFFSLAVGIEMPLLINVGILLDILMGVLMLVLFINKVGERMKSIDSEGLTQLKD